MKAFIFYSIELFYLKKKEKNKIMKKEKSRPLSLIFLNFLN